MIFSMLYKLQLVYFIYISSLLDNIIYLLSLHAFSRGFFGTKNDLCMLAVFLPIIIFYFMDNYALFIYSAKTCLHGKMPPSLGHKF
jgi:hypothetical protein